MIDCIISNQGTLLVKGTIDDKDVTLNSNKLKKTPSYGGRGAGSGTKVEDAALADAVFGLNKLNEGKAVVVKTFWQNCLLKGFSYVQFGEYLAITTIANL